MSPDGKPIQVNASALQAAAAQNAVGKLYIVIGLEIYLQQHRVYTTIVISSKRGNIYIRS